MTIARSALGGLVLLCATAASATETPCWQKLEPESRLGFVATWQDTPFNGEFVRFTADICFAPDRLQSSHFDVTVDVTSADSGSRDRDQAMGEREWFDFANHPAARFVATRFERADETRFIAAGELSIKGRTRPLRLPFSWRAVDDGAVLRVEVVLQRTDFGIGEGEWADDSIIGIAVRVIADVALEPLD